MATINSVQTTDTILQGLAKWNANDTALNAEHSDISADITTLSGILTDQINTVVANLNITGSLPLVGSGMTVALSGLTALGGSGQVMKMNQAGTALEWATDINYNAAGSTGQLQFNNAGNFSADSNLVWNNTEKRLGVGSTSPISKLTFEPTQYFTASYENGITFKHPTENRVCAIQPFRVDSGLPGMGLVFGANLYLNTAGAIDRFNDSEESAGLRFDRVGDIDFYTGPDDSDASVRIRINNTGNIGINETGPETLLEMTHEEPYITLHNDTHEDTDGGRESKIIFKGELSTGLERTLAVIQASHDGTGTDQKGDLIFYTNDGDDNNSPTERLRIDSAGDVRVAGQYLYLNDYYLRHTGTLFVFGDVLRVPEAVEVFWSEPFLHLWSNSHTDADGGRRGTLRFRGERSGGEAVYQADIVAEHDGTGDDQYSRFIIYVNDGTGLVERLRIDKDGNVGLNTQTATSLLHVNGPIATAIETFTSDDSLDNTNSIVLLDGSSNTVIATLPDATTCEGREYTLKAIDITNLVSLAFTNSQTIDGQTSFYFSNKNEVLKVVSDGSNWQILYNSLVG